MKGTLVIKVRHLSDGKSPLIKGKETRVKVKGGIY